MKRLLAIILITNLFATTAYATCTAEICIDVVADPTSNQIVITASKKGVLVVVPPERTLLLDQNVLP